jgi:hypothetical protein
MDRLLAAAFIVLIYAAFGWQGVIGCFTVLTVFHTAYRCKHGHWFGE